MAATFFCVCFHGPGPRQNIIKQEKHNNAANFLGNLQKFKERFKFYQIRFSDLDKALTKNVDTIIFDLGLSSIQLKNLKRGFSFNSKESPDMRMGLNSINAQEVLNNFNLKTLTDIFKLLGEEKDGFRIARNIVKARKKKAISSIDELVNIIKRSKRNNFKKKINISTKAFQAIRIFVNKEISELVDGLIKATKLLKAGGKIVVVNFHSIEDKIVKFFFTNFSGNKSRGSRYYPEQQQKNILFENYKNKVIKPSIKEIEINSPSRSAKLRFATRSKDNFFYPEDLKNKFSNYLELENRYV